MGSQGGRQVGGSSGEDYIEDTTAKHFLDSIGKIVHNQVKNGGAETYKDELKGKLSLAKVSGGETAGTADPCKLDYSKLINGSVPSGITARGDPCGNTTGKEDVNRFSDTQGAECTKSKIKYSDYYRGACAPFRRLNLCNKNMVKMDTNNNDGKAKHDLLVDVCYAAKFEGESITRDYPKYETQYPGSGSTMCTMLARSFADIGDIVRGKDLYLGNKKKKQNGKETEREKLEEKLKQYFKNIYNELTSERNGVKDHYKDDGDNYYKLREDWWIANRHTVWEAITCNAWGNTYFRATCDTGKGPSQARNKCTCNNGDVPTYFDYVPQYLRWFEEWAEDFCRKKKQKLENVQKQCRGENGKDKYCSRNGYDCEKTKRAIGKYRMGNQCTKCLFACNPYVDWIDNQRKQFDKQVKKYTDEINGTSSSSGGGGSRRQKRGVRSNNNYEGYEKIFYKKLKEGGYKDVGKFLNLLSKEKTCKDITDGGTIHFEKVNSGSASDSGTNNENEGTFYRSEYCQPCPHCGVKKKRNGDSGNQWEKKNNENCKNIKLYKPINGKNGTPIEILKSGDEEKEIAEKLNKFCQTQNGSDGGGGGNSDSQKLYQEWKCYQFDQLVKDKVGEVDEDDHDYENDVQTGGGLCILKNTNKTSDKEPEQFQKTFNNFFNFWVAHVLKDSIYWRTKKLERCLKNKKTCGNNKCNTDCECFKRWVEQKKEKEWKPIKEHFGKQKDLLEQIGKDTDPGIILEGVLEKEVLLTSIKEGYGNAEDIKHIEELLQEEEAAGAIAGGEHNTTIDKLLQHEKEDATKCKKCQEPQQPADKGGGARSDSGSPDTPPRVDQEEEEESGDEGEDEEDDGPDGEDHAVDVAEEEPQQETQPKVEVNPCHIVETLFSSIDKFSDACTQKYGQNAPVGWKCVNTTTTTGDSTTSSGNGEHTRKRRSADSPTTSSGEKGTVCIPPRRRRLYVGKLEEWADKVSKSQETSETSSPGGKETPSGDKLRDAFIQSAAVETFFAWHKYKVENTKTQGVATGLLRFDGSYGDSEDDEDKDPQKKLQESGKIPEDFIRQMFYTLGDYRDIFFGNNMGNGNDMKKVKSNIDKVFANGVQEREQWWKIIEKDVWYGMLCALSYDTNYKTFNADVHTQLISPKNNNYDYTNVSFSGGFNSDKNAATITTKLEEFSRRPTFFRWLEEWGEEFCKKRTYKLKRIKDECRSDKYGKRYSSGDGEDCQNMLREDYNIVPDLEYPGCGKSCKSYKDWINTKKKEFKKHEEKYKMEISNNKSNSDNTYHIEFYKNIKTTNHTATQFLASLKEGSCCNNNNGENKINFNEQGEIFGHAKLCAPCPVFGVKRNKDDWINITDKTCKGKKFTEENIKNNKNRNEKVHMLVIDNSTKDFAEELEVCRDKGIFDGIRKDEWSCGYVCDVDICDLESVKEGMDDQKNIQIRAVLKQWLENFLKDYNKINDKISQCNKNGKESICINKCKNKCVCAEKWVDEKLKEWEKVKKRFFDQYHINDSQVYEVKSFLSKNIFSSGVQNILDEVKDSETLQKSAGCTNSASTKEQKCEKKDVITILIDRFKEKITSCKNQPDDGTHSNCDDSLEPLDPETPDEQPEEDPDTSTTSVVPHICEQFVAPEPQPPAPPAQDRTSEDASTEEKEEVPFTPSLPPEDLPPEKNVPVPPPKKPSTPRRRPREITRSILPEMVSISAFPLSVGIAFAALSYFLLKKKTKSTIDLLRVINIPKGDYGIPTMKSKNRYIPYASDRYKGKTYIYMEGDSDSGHYYEDTTDITSSESEYEEFDINDIYVPGSSKYKTLIEVVLEPSKRDTMNTQNDIPLNDKLDSNKLTDEEWNQLKQDFISNISQNSQMDLPKNNISGNIQMDTHPHVNILDDSMQEKPFITSIHDRDLHNGEEVTYNINLDDHKNMNFSTNHDNIPPKNDQNDLYTGIDLINDSISGNHNVNIYDELLKRKENELFGTNHTKHTTTNIVAKQTHNDPIVNQINLFHKWLDRHRNMCEQWDKNKKEELLDKLNEEWNKENKNNSNVTDTNGENNITRVLNSDVSIQIDMNSKPI
ncbi:hypothetical protein PFDG_02422 [Plasmodium falciparum Dd2]|uniref:Erythrocyte membrane protein 1 n=2 Tax=Plasmodium falciparum TaxID=5833 RepID=A0A0L7M164_PLAF4|nr:hypothetical protein PFDG_02422 [Plasmodium falciparum Dd2]